MSGPATVLICEDNADLCDNLRELLELLELRVVTADTVAAASARLEAGPPPQLLLTDLKVAGDSGLDLIRRARAQLPDLPVILVSGFLDDETRRVAEASGVQAVFDKPIDHAALLERVQTLAGRSHEGRASPPRPSPTSSSALLEVVADGRRPTLAGVRVALVDDNVDHGDNLAEFLGGLGAEVTRAYSCAEALSMAPSDVSLVDIRLPDGSGTALIAPLREAREPPGEVLLVTGHASMDGAIAALRQGAYAYLLKPVDLDELEITLRHAAESVQMRQREADLLRRLQESEAQLRTLVDHTQVLLLVLDDAQRVLQANAAVEALIGRSEAELIGRDWVESQLAAERRELAREELRASSRAPVDIPVLEPVLSADGSIREISWLSRTLPTPEGLRLFRAGLDVTEARAAQARIARAEKLAAVGTLAAGLAHEIRNPLNGANLQLQVLERRLGKAALPDAVAWTGPVQVVRDEIARLGRLVETFMSFARPRPLDPRRVELAPLLERVCTMSRALADAGKVRLERAEISPGLAVRGDPDRLNQVLSNLLRNAIEASPAGQVVELTLRRVDRKVELRIRDHGPGIPGKLRARVFEPFFTTKEGGTGLGLAISHAIVDQHEGTLEFEIDGGTEAVLTLPAAD